MWDNTAIKSYSPELIVHPVLKAQSSQMLAVSPGTCQQEQDAVEALIARSTSEVALCIPYIYV
jgi:NAD(P)H-hydrate repair Nnr-like enzyme with NAD(P)H-hydrate dehydratase domain